MEIEAIKNQTNDSLADSLQSRVDNLNDAVQAQGADVPFLVNELERASELYARLFSDQGRWDTPQKLSKRIVEKMLARELPGADQGQAAVIVNALMGEHVNQAGRVLYEGDDGGLMPTYEQALDEYDSSQPDESALPAQIQALRDVLRRSPSVELNERNRKALAKASIAKALDEGAIDINVSPENDSVIVHYHAFDDEREFPGASFFDDVDTSFEPREIFSNHTLSQAVARKAEIHVETEGYTARKRLDSATDKLINP